MHRLIKAGIVGLLGLFFITPATKESVETIADTAMDNVPVTAAYAPMLQLMADHVYLLLFILWVGVIMAILFWPTGTSSRIEGGF